MVSHPTTEEIIAFNNKTNKEVKEIDVIAKDFIKSKYYECIKDKVPSVVIHGAKTQLGWNETNKLDITSGEEPIKINIKIDGADY